MGANEKEQETNPSLRSYDELKKNFDEMLFNWFGDEPLPEIQARAESADRMKEDATVFLSVHPPSPPRSIDKAL